MTKLKGYWEGRKCFIYRCTQHILFTVTDHSDSKRVNLLLPLHGLLSEEDRGMRVIILLYINFRPPKLPTVPLAFSLISRPHPLPNGMSGSATNSFQLPARVLLYAPSYRQDYTYHSLCYTSRGALVVTRHSLIVHHERSTRRPNTP